MNEQALINTLLAIGLVCLLIVVASNIIFLQLLAKLMVNTVIPQLLCQSDDEGNYILSTQTSLDFCGDINDLQKITNPQFCMGYADADKREACLGLMELSKSRSSDCLSLLFGETKTSVSSANVAAYCQVIKG
jgi:hypothetical protein